MCLFLFSSFLAIVSRDSQQNEQLDVPQMYVFSIRDRRSVCAE